MLYQVAIRKGAGFNLVSIREFLAMPASARVQLILEDKVQFLDEKGAVVQPLEAMQLLRKLRETEGSS